MDIYEVRKKNLIAQIGDTEPHGAVAKFAREHDLDPTYVRQIINDHRKMGEKAARKLEEALNISPGQLDFQEPAGEYRVNSISSTTRALIEAFESSSPEMQEAALRMLGVVAEIDKNKREK